MTRTELLEIKEMYRSEAIPALIDFCNENGLEEMVSDFIDTDYLDEYVQHEAEGGWQRVACFLAKVECLNDDWYILDGYGNLKEIERVDLDCIIDDILSYHADLFEEEDEEE